ncbi:hypothetical protein M2360_003960 [Rhizobium sp. SG_E_25_P2]|uniref:hypothetical protein n=1 Tax=Rhizobium sp. SG_E_25_P2 TaxID=2879942 RepID=UPI002475A958|nr:hypothetical protein [Rhizobium sp. SG_E_25_P2]MDH6268554.1 hypothetical protein [Rhizobium sp. SG_E_25_P2]
MFAGRYLRWAALAVGAWVFFSFYLYYASWLFFRLSGCAAAVGGCGDVEARLNAVVRPYGLFAAAAVLLAASVLRIHYLRMSPLWGLALFVWFGASAEFLMTVGNLWFAHIPLEKVLAALPIETFYLAALVAFLCFPVELFRRAEQPGLRLIAYVAGFVASYSFSFTVATSTSLPAYVYWVSGSVPIAQTVVHVQAALKPWVAPADSGLMPAAAALAVFLACLSFILASRKTPIGQPLTV